MIRCLVIVRFVLVASCVKKKTGKEIKAVDFRRICIFLGRLLEFLLIIVTRGKFIVAKNGLEPHSNWKALSGDVTFYLFYFTSFLTSIIQTSIFNFTSRKIHWTRA